MRHRGRGRESRDAGEELEEHLASSGIDSSFCGQGDYGGVAAVSCAIFLKGRRKSQEAEETSYSARKDTQGSGGVSSICGYTHS